MITVWFNHLLKAVKLLEKHDYVAVNDIETLEIFIEFKRKDKTDDIYAGAITVPPEKASNIHEAVVITSLPYYKYRFINEKITYQELKAELLKKCKQYIQELEKINPELILAGRIQRLITKMSQLSNSL
ncbi:hypothetical protein H2C83_12995 [Thermoactinomyces sp. AMNI-1]|uniref:Uncharacterized protein n=1 Tax=Thermoactinomyces mirandus TaxID=2756294 RepID=A0A7W2AS40_9BACL|nr:hypothetical protein [Thermoactinomyces mirandus]